MNIKLSLFLLLASILSCKQYEFELDGEISEGSIYSSIIDDTFELYTFLPGSYDNKNSYPVIILQDGNWYFDDFARELNDLIRRNEIHSSILIGIGYRDEIDKKRFRDFTFPEDPDYDIKNGEADLFSIFLKEELIPQIKADYSTDTTQYILMGHSLGGLNTLYNMLQIDSPFSGFVAVSSSLWWSDGFLFGTEEQLSESSLGLNAKAYIAVGGDEPPSMTILNQEFIERLHSRNYDGFILKSDSFKGASHSQVPLIGFRKGIKFIFK